MKKISVILLLFCTIGHAQDELEEEAKQAPKQKITHKYKKYEKFDFEDLAIEGDTGAPGDLSITPRYQQLYKNRLPYRKNFNAEIKKAVERIK